MIRRFLAALRRHLFYFFSTPEPEMWSRREWREACRKLWPEAHEAMPETAWWMETCQCCGRRFDSEAEGLVRDDGRVSESVFLCGACFDPNHQNHKMP